MNKIKLVDVQFSGRFENKLSGHLTSIDYEFDFGKAYLIEGSKNFASWILSWLISGKIEPDSGNILLDDVTETQTKIREQSWAVRYDQIKQWGLFDKTIGWQVRVGLQSQLVTNGSSEEEIIEAFKLTPERYNRKLSQLSNEAWRASCAIGYAYGKRVFCFPDMDYLSPNFVKEYRKLWLEDMLRFLTTSNALIIMPSSFSDPLDGLFDEVVILQP